MGESPNEITEIADVEDDKLILQNTRDVLVHYLVVYIYIINKYNI